MNRFDQNWQKLVALARQAPVDDDAPLPPGFATRVAAQAFTRPASPWGGLERFALRGFVAAAACCIAAVAFSYFDPGAEPGYDTALDDSVLELLDIS
ncbi:MAG: hypothetical protein ACOZE5_01110 [Verrucomicrobiota bacterium]